MLVEVATMSVLWGAAIMVGQHHNFHHYYQQCILIAVSNNPLVQVGLVGLAVVVGRWEVEEEEEMVQGPRKKAGEDQEGGVW